MLDGEPLGARACLPDKRLSIERYGLSVVSARYDVKLTGIYEIRWYGSTRRGGLCEITRGRCELQAAGDCRRNVIGAPRPIGTEVLVARLSFAFSARPCASRRLRPRSAASQPIRNARRMCNRLYGLMSSV